MVLAVTGHRPTKLWGYDYTEPHYLVMKETIKDFIVKNNIEDVWDGMALGVDTIAALGVLELRDSGYDVKLHCASPCKNYFCKWPIYSQNVFKSIWDRADEKIIVTGINYQPWVLSNRNYYMVDKANMVLAIWDGSASGTANCVHYAERTGKPVVIINPANIAA